MQSPILCGMESPSVPYQQLTYLQFCMMPQLFQNYLNSLLMREQYKKLGDLFVLYSQTFMEFVPQPDFQMKSRRQSIIGVELFKILKLILKNMPLQLKQLVFHNNINTSVYTSIIQFIIEQVKQSTQDQEQRQNCIEYYQSLTGYFKMLQIQLDISRGKKINNIFQKKEQLKKIQNYFSQDIENLRRNNIIYAKYCDKFMKLLKKMLYIFEVGDNSKQNELKQKQIRQNHPYIRQQQLQSLRSTCLYHLYPSCLTRKQKQRVIRSLFQRYIKTGQVQKSTKIKQIQLLTLLYLQQHRSNKVTDKLQVYLVLVGIKIYRYGTVSRILQQLKIIYSFERIPSIQSSYLILYSIINAEIEQCEEQTQKIKQIIDYILKSYSKIHNNNDKLYIRLAILSSLYLHFKNHSTSNGNGSGSIKSANRKQLLQKLFEYQDIIEYINNKNLVNYVMQLVWVGRQIKLFQRQATNASNKGKSSGPSSQFRMQLQHMQVNLLDYLCPYKDVQPLFYQHIIRINLVQDSSGNAEQPQLSVEKLIQLLISLVLKQQQLTNPLDHLEYFHSKLLVLILKTQFCTKFNDESLCLAISILQQVCLASTYNMLNDKLIRLLFYILIFSLDSHSIKQGLIGLMLIDQRWVQSEIVQIKVQMYLTSHKQEFKNMNQQLFDCIMGFYFVQLLADSFRELYDVMMNNWIEKTQNYLYPWPQSRRDKLLLLKREKFISYLKNKFYKNNTHNNYD